MSKLTISKLSVYSQSMHQRETIFRKIIIENVTLNDDLKLILDIEQERGQNWSRNPSSTKTKESLPEQLRIEEKQ